MKKAIKIGGLYLTYPLEVSSEMESNNYISQKNLATDGSTIIFAQPKDDLSLEVTLSSGKFGWQEDSVRTALMGMVGTTPVTVLYDDGTSDSYVFDHTKVPMRFTELYSGSCYFSVEIKLLKTV